MRENEMEIVIKMQKTRELSPEDNRLRISAVRAAKRAYAPYSRYNVGAAVLLEDGTIIEGNNQENIAYPSGLCAERVALFYAGASHPAIPVVSIAIVAVKDGEVRESVSPCGACRQALLETEQRYGKPVRVLMCGRDEVVVVFSAKDLLPLSFGMEQVE
ncbi:MAG: cytidine deaminase [Tannerella sp.]|jgi:cytidine deaminase|nr:cytidine deaminase [Tannerella sp.]